MSQKDCYQPKEIGTDTRSKNIYLKSDDLDVQAFKTNFFLNIKKRFVGAFHTIIFCNNKVFVHLYKKYTQYQPFS